MRVDHFHPGCRIERPKVTPSTLARSILKESNGRVDALLLHPCHSLASSFLLPRGGTVSAARRGDCDDRQGPVLVQGAPGREAIGGRPRAGGASAVLHVDGVSRPRPTGAP